MGDAIQNAPEEAAWTSPPNSCQRSSTHSRPTSVWRNVPSSKCLTTNFTSLSTQVVNPHVFRHMPVNPQKDFIPLAGTMKAGLIMAVGPSVPHKTAKDLFDFLSDEPDLAISHPRALLGREL